MQISTRLLINSESDKPEAPSQIRLNVIQLRNRAFPVSPPKIPPRSSFVVTDRLSGEDNPDLGFMTTNATVTYVGQNVSSELDTDQRKGIKDQLIFAARHLDDRICFFTNRLYDEYDDLPLPPGPCNVTCLSEGNTIYVLDACLLCASIMLPFTSDKLYTYNVIRHGASYWDIYLKLIGYL